MNREHWTYTHTKLRPILPQFINVSIWLCVQLIKVMIMKLFNCVYHAFNNGMGRIEHIVGVLLIAFLVFHYEIGFGDKNWQN